MRAQGVQIGYQSKIRGNKRSDRMPRQHSLLWFTDRPGNTLTPLPTRRTRQKKHTRAYWLIRTSTRECASTHTHTGTGEVCAHDHTQAQSGIRTSHRITSHHTGCEGDLLSLWKENKAGWKCSLRMLPSLSIIQLATIAHRKQKAI